MATEPKTTGLTYEDLQRLVRSDTLTSPILPGLSLSVDEILGPRED